MKFRLEHIRFIGFQSRILEASVRFSNSQTSIIYGDNGSGKTTFLKLIHAVLSKDESTLIKEKVKCVEISLIDEMDIGHKVKIIQEEDDEAGGGISATSTFNWKEFDASGLSRTRSLSMGVDRGTTIQPAQVEGSDIFRFLVGSSEVKLERAASQVLSENLAAFLNRTGTLRTRTRSILRSKNNDLLLHRDHAFLQSVNMSNIETLLTERYREARDYASSQIQNALFDTLAVAIDSENKTPQHLPLPQDLATQIAEGKERIIEALNDGPENESKNKIIGVLTDLRIQDGTLTNNPILGQLLWNMTKELKIEKQLLNAINQFVDTFNSFLSNKKIEITKQGVQLIVRGVSLNIDSLSSGERHLFTFLALVVIDARERDFLIIDEPEISLNANWQRQLIPLLQDLAPDTQIIVASHSPILAHKRPSSLVELKPTEL
ncbi:MULTISPECIES: AAA family ATPase [unclassified Pseudomonas]|uniref:AAA family ATPase n=1 Tax=Pseudomonas TaxID=286 RepID=UPI000A1E96EE|nr:MULTISPECIES: AAA family ATPase [unclassified Pseudomonas]